MASFTNNPTVMVVEDSDDTRNILMEFLVLKGCRVIEADNGKEAVALIRRKCPDVILMDLRMPLMDGLTATSQIRQYRNTCSKVPIIAITAHDGTGTKESALEAGCTEYLTKPIDFPLLEKMLREILGDE